jgi:hypothetical protein
MGGVVLLLLLPVSATDLAIWTTMPKIPTMNMRTISPGPPRDEPPPLRNDEPPPLLRNDEPPPPPL